MSDDVSDMAMSEAGPAEEGSGRGDRWRVGERLFGALWLLAGAGGVWLFWPPEGSDDQVAIVILDTYVVHAAFFWLVAVFLSACVGLVGSWMLLAPGRVLAAADREGQRDVGPHHDRGDGHCGHCYQPWPCAASRTA